MWELAERQYGVIARWQLKALGYGSGRVDWLRDSGALERVMCGVYRIQGRRVPLDGSGSLGHPWVQARPHCRDPAVEAGSQEPTGLAARVDVLQPTTSL
jgi:hypothetical protein